MAELVTRVDRDPMTTPFLAGWRALWSAIALNVGQVFLLATDGTPAPRATCAANRAPGARVDPSQPRSNPTKNDPALRKDKS